MYTNLWVKYLPVMRILLKKSLKEEQVFLMNIPDFERAGIKRKTGLKFLLMLKDGKPGNVIVAFPLAASLATVLQEDAAIRELLTTNEFHVSLNTKYELTITHVPQPQEAVVEAA
jgi:hypothetical protein